MPPQINLKSFQKLKNDRPGQSEDKFEKNTPWIYWNMQHLLGFIGYYGFYQFLKSLMTQKSLDVGYGIHLLVIHSLSH